MGNKNSIQFDKNAILHQNSQTSTTGSVNGVQSSSSINHKNVNNEIIQKLGLSDFVNFLLFVGIYNLSPNDQSLSLKNKLLNYIANKRMPHTKIGGKDFEYTFQDDAISYKNVDNSNESENYNLKDLL